MDTRFLYQTAKSGIHLLTVLDIFQVQLEMIEIKLKNSNKFVFFFYEKLFSDGRVH